MRILVTRPQPGADETATRLKARGHEALVDPLTSVVFSPEPKIGNAPAAIAVTSRNGAHALSGWNAAKSWRDLPLFAVGASSAAAAADAGFGNIVAADGDVAHLATLIRARFTPGAGAILYPAARDRAGDLVAELQAAGIATILVEAYRAVAVAHLDAAVAASLGAGRIDGVLFHSQRSARVFVELATAAGIVDGLRATRLIALSARVAEPLAALAGAPIEVARRPDEAALLDLAIGPAEDGPAAIRPL